MLISLVLKGAFLRLNLKDHYKSDAADREGYKISSKNFKITYSINSKEREADPCHKTGRIDKVTDLIAEQGMALRKQNPRRGYTTIPFLRGVKVQVQVAE
ncbi:predicted protein [Sclerotinia sclerotiorum 1980 UF-70]|uniref:Uncharacterized protein n=1 Tax=Sclerotinia sclerotiorum (strain ATCC 18683 / 1980 / Ss-1) TaxID=665079 RepID=A7EBB5_SCLS1|nr:predicted protein [Sclerotinia sclerotiorum 1980 UF-70]EDN99743.1 predicted protein [Sclerotinia sclerotiorum 1980 UF-70]